jgi:Arc/MetJ-type ribon-helix-helix transcriptional regulator
MVYHVLNRSVGRMHLFRKDADFEAFQRVMIEAHQRQERFVHDAVRAGLYTSEDAVVSDALDRFQQTMSKPARTSGKGAAKRTQSAPQKPRKPLTRAEFDQHLLAIDRGHIRVFVLSYFRDRFDLVPPQFVSHPESQAREPCERRWPSR